MMSKTAKALSHSSSTFNREPPWSSIHVEKLPALAFCDSGKQPHHWVRDGKVDEKSGKYAAGELFLHRGACIEAYRKAVERGDPPADLQHLKDHLDEIGYKPAAKSPPPAAPQQSQRSPKPPDAQHDPADEIEVETLGADRIEAEIDAARAEAEVQDWELAAINRTLTKPLAKDEVYTFAGWISNGEPDSYSTRMDPDTTLHNFVEDMIAGRALCIAHSPSRGGFLGPVGEAAATMPVGRSFHGELVARPDRPGSLWVRGYWYIVRGVAVPGGMKTDDVIRNIETGVWHRLSVGFTLNPIEGRKRGFYRCELCNEPLMSKKCEHIPGLEYEGKLAIARIIDGSQREASLVYLNAAQGTVVSKARVFAAEGRIEARQIEQLEELHGVRIIQPGGQAPLGSSKREPTGATPETKNKQQENNMDLARELLKGMVEAFRSVLPESPLRVKVVALATRVESAEKEEGIREAAAAFSALVTEARADYAALKIVHDAVPEASRSPDKIAVLVTEAGEGRQYRADLTAAALVEGVRAEGNTFDKDHWTKALAGQPLSFIQKQRDIWKGQADSRIEPGRKSQEAAGAGIVIPAADAARLPPAIPDAAYKTGR